MKEQHSEAENRTELYEDVLLGKKLWTRLYRKLFWNGVSKKQIVKAMLKYIPEDFKGSWMYRQEQDFLLTGNTHG